MIIVVSAVLRTTEQLSGLHSVQFCELCFPCVPRFAKIAMADISNKLLYLCLQLKVG